MQQGGIAEQEGQEGPAHSTSCAALGVAAEVAAGGARPTGLPERVETRLAALVLVGALVLCLGWGSGCGVSRIQG